MAKIKLIAANGNHQWNFCNVSTFFKNYHAVEYHLVTLLAMSPQGANTNKKTKSG